jgi:carboxypeptidase C (cathepsin A)
LTVFKRWNSPKFLFGESYGTTRTCVLAWLLHEDGVDLNGIVLQSSILDYSQTNNSVGLLPTLAPASRFKPFAFQAKSFQQVSPLLLRARHLGTRRSDRLPANRGMLPTNAGGCVRGLRPRASGGFQPHIQPTGFQPVVV